MSELVLLEVKNGIGFITLNSEKSLNSLSQLMVKETLTVLRQWKYDHNVSCIFFEGAGEKAFCAGGDVRQLYKALQNFKISDSNDPSDECFQFFISEYTLDYEIHRYPKPILLWGNGIVMGGGLGLMNGASHRIVTETSKLAMPEITIGLYPDVGATYFLNKLPSGWGIFLGMTAARINGTDALHLKLADHFIPRMEKENLLKELSIIQWSTEQDKNKVLVSDVLNKISKDSTPPVPVAYLHHDLMAKFAGVKTVKEFIDVLTTLPKDEWIQEAERTFLHGSPSSRAIILEQLRRGKRLSLEEVFQSELNLSVHCSLKPDFPEGVRALLIDKDQRPEWSPPSDQAVTQEWIESYFIPLWKDRDHPLKNLGMPSTKAF